MAELVAEPKKQLAFDTDWRTALEMASLFVVCALFFASSIFRIIRGAKPTVGVDWHSWIFLSLCVLVVLQSHERQWQTVALIASLNPASRILLHILGANVDLQMANVAFLRVIDLMLFGGACAYISWWFKSKVRYV